MPHPIGTGLILLLVFAPLAFGAVETWAAAALEAAAFALLGAAWMRRPDSIRLPGALYALIASALAVGLYQWLASATLGPSETGGAVRLGLAYAAVFLLVVSVARTEAEIHRIVLALIVTGFAAALFAILQKYSWNGKVYWIREVREAQAVFGPFINRNHFAGYLAMLVPLAVGYTVAAFAGTPARGQTAGRRLADRLTSERASRLALLLFMTLTMAVALVLSLSRSGIVSLAAAVALIGAIFWMSRSMRRWALLPGVLVCGLIPALAWFGAGPVLDRLGTLLRLAGDPSMQGRARLWRDTLAIVGVHPWTGTGLGTFGAVYPGYKTLPDPYFYEHAHNDYLQLLAETGWIGLAAGLGALAVLAGLIAAGWRERRSLRTRGLLAGLATGGLALLIHGLTDFNFHIPANAVLFAAFIGMAWNLSRPEGREEAVAPGPVLRFAALPAGLAVLCLLIYQAAADFTADRHFQSGLESEQAGRLEAAGASYRRAIAWIGNDPHYHVALGRVQERLYLRGETGALDPARAEFERAAALAPTLAGPRLHLGWIHAQRGDTAAAAAEFRNALRLDPTNPNLRAYIEPWMDAAARGLVSNINLAKEGGR